MNFKVTEINKQINAIWIQSYHTCTTTLLLSQLIYSILYVTLKQNYLIKRQTIVQFRSVQENLFRPGVQTPGAYSHSVSNSKISRISRIPNIFKCPVYWDMYSKTIHSAVPSPRDCPLTCVTLQGLIMQVIYR